MIVLRLWGLCGLLGLAACQPSSVAAHESAPSQASPQATAASSHMAILPAHCENIPLQMSAITANSDVQSLAVVNQALKRCVPEVDDATRHQWMADSQLMYERFLDLKTTEANQYVWDEFSWTLEGYPQESHDERQSRLQQQKDMWPKLNVRMKQMSQWLGQEYIDNFYLGEGMMHLRRSPQYLLDIFAPQLPKAERVFMQQLGKENLSLTSNDAALAIPLSEVANRAVFWEQYREQYPDSPYRQWAQYQFEAYRAMLLLGMDNTPLFENHTDQLFITPENLLVHTQLAKRTDTALAAKSQQVLDWLETYSPRWSDMSDAQKEQAIQTYNKTINIQWPDLVPVPDTKNQHYNCSFDAICHPQSWG